MQRLPFIFLYIFLLPGAVDGIIISVQGFFLHSEIYYMVIIGFSVGTLAYFLFIKNNEYFKTWEHEATHAIIAICLFRKIDRFIVTDRRGGYVSHRGGFLGELGDDLIGLAPYFLPTFSFIFALIYPFIIDNLYLQQCLIFLIGFFLAYHTFSTIEELKDNWSKNYFISAAGENILSDIGRRGYMLSFFQILSLTLICHSIIFILITYSYRDLLIFLKEIFNYSVDFYKPFFAVITPRFIGGK